MLTGVIFIDLIKASDTVKHIDLLHTLLSFSIYNNTYFKSYLCNREQTV